MKHFFFIALSLLSVTANAQQDPLYAQYMNNPFMLNPAYAGFHNSFNASVGYRQQWTGMEGPKTFNLTADISALSSRVGTGLVIFTDRIGATSRTELMAAYAYKIPLSTSVRLSFGLQGGVIHHQIDHSKLKVFDRSDPLFEGSENVWTPNAGAGFLVSNEHFFVGLSVPRLFEPSATLSAVDHTLLSRHYYLTGAYLFPLSPQLVFKPSILLRYVSGAPLSVDVNASFMFHEKFQIGIFTRNLETYGGLFQFVMKDNFRLGYVCEVPTGNAIASNFVTHEFTLTLRMKVLNFHESQSIMRF